MEKYELIKLIEKFPEKKWNWFYISSNPNVTMEYIEKHPEKDWHWDIISRNKFLYNKKCAKYKIELRKYIWK